MAKRSLLSRCPSYFSRELSVGGCDVGLVCLTNMLWATTDVVLNLLGAGLPGCVLQQGC